MNPRKGSHRFLTFPLFPVTSVSATASTTKTASWSFEGLHRTDATPLPSPTPSTLNPEGGLLSSRLTVGSFQEENYFPEQLLLDHKVTTPDHPAQTCPDNPPVQAYHQLDGDASFEAGPDPLHHLRPQPPHPRCLLHHRQQSSIG